MKGNRTRQSILYRAVDLASTDGLEGLTIGRLADDLKMSKSGLFAHFGSKEELQLATIKAAKQRFLDEVFRPALQVEPLPGWQSEKIVARKLGRDRQNIAIGPGWIEGEQRIRLIAESAAEAGAIIGYGWSILAQYGRSWSLL